MGIFSTRHDFDLDLRAVFVVNPNHTIVSAVDLIDVIVQLVVFFDFLLFLVHF